MKNPYQGLPKSAFWRTAVAVHHPLGISGLWRPKHRWSLADKVATAGSCFAQHIGRALIARGFNWLDGEPAPAVFDESTRKEFNYGVFSFRTGNIYTVAALKQWVDWSFGHSEPPEELWQQDGRFFDPFRPNIEPGGFASREELIASRESTLRAIGKVLAEAEVFIFTLGLTEAWINRSSGAVYPMCPGTVAGKYDPAVHVFRNFRFDQIYPDLIEVFELIKRANDRVRFLLTVSPVPLTATASGHHVLTATTYSKSVLRAVAGQLADERDDVDYFPSYEIITAPPFRGMFYEPNLRTVAPQGVEFVMDSFFSCLESVLEDSSRPKAGARGGKGNRRRDAIDVVCEEEMLEAFGDETR